jgi:predicted nucleic acid-binding protein
MIDEPPVGRQAACPCPPSTGYHPPAPLELALTDLAAILASASLVLLAETSRHAGIMETILHESSVTGNLVHDAHIAALCPEHGVTELLTGDRDFARFSALRVSDPFRRA